MHHSISSDTAATRVSDMMISAAADRRSRLVADAAPAAARRRLSTGGRGHRFTPLRRLETWLAAGQL